MSHPRNRFRVALLIVTVVLALPASAAVWTIDPNHPSGLDCALIGGSWFDSLATCVVVNATIGADDGLIILPGATLETFQSFDNFGSIENEGTISFDRFENWGSVINTGDIEVRDEFANHGTVDNTNSVIGVAPGGEFWNWGDIGNTDSTISIGCHPAVGVGENFGTIVGGGITGCDSNIYGPTRFVNHRDGNLQNMERVSSMDFLNLGTVVIGTISSFYSGGFPLRNRGVLEFRVGAMIDETLVNEDDGVLLTSAAVENRGVVTNLGLWVNTSRFENNVWFDSPGFLGWTANYGLILNHTAGRLGWTGDLSEGGTPPLPRNFGTISHHEGGPTDLDIVNNGTIYTCSATDSDQDADLVCDPVDCAISDPSAWSPRLATNLTLEPAFAGQVRLRWEAPLYLGGSSIGYDILTSLDPMSFADPMNCSLAIAIGTTALDASPVSPGETRHYLIRAAGCASGTAGQNSAGVDRVVADCP